MLEDDMYVDALVMPVEKLETIPDFVRTFVRKFIPLDEADSDAVE